MPGADHPDLVACCDPATGFLVLPGWQAVKRTFTWRCRLRRLARQVARPIPGSTVQLGLCNGFSKSAGRCEAIQNSSYWKEVEARK